MPEQNDESYATGSILLMTPLNQLNLSVCVRVCV